ncbi:hypothetical protein [Acinetobacter baumannii]|uniref:hypothetical protein n=1 Tax=Acinetobacter baumannii TaxID=470 RepID=UPI0024DE9576|nr:hypothetical protein [Acinetobacter baumannii]MDK2223328.1 hypothetical protein [Acinetobacter baumannii]MDK2234218.1 hypothetical protein [Acinetobacter baumannii]
MEIKNEIAKDYEEYCNQRLISEFGNYKAGGHNPMHLYHRYKYRILDAYPRQVIEPHNFTIPTEHLSAYRKIISDIKSGNPLNKYQSRRLKRLDYDDDMLSHWRIQHFHLGENLESDGFVSRTPDLLFIHFSNTEAHIIGFFSHKDWCNLDIIETIHNNWPKLLISFKSESTSEPLTEEQYRILRTKNAITTVKVQDGTEYHAPGLGVVANGSPIEAITNVQRILITFENSFDAISTNIHQILEADPQKRTTEIATIGLEMDEANQRFVYIIKETGHRFTLDYE